MLITGASQGIGRALAVHFAAKAAELILTARSESKLKETAKMVELAGGRCAYHASDLRRLDTLEALTEQMRERGTKVNILVNNAADVTSKPFLETSVEEIESLIRTNVIGCLQLSRLVVPMMIERGEGMIVNVSSLAGYKPNPAQTVYSISKAAVNGMSEALRAELSGKGIHVMNVALASVGVEDEPLPGQIPVERFAARLERAIAKNETELFLSPITKWLMRLYRFYPPLARLR